MVMASGSLARSRNTQKRGQLAVMQTLCTSLNKVGGTLYIPTRAKAIEHTYATCSYSKFTFTL